MKDLLNSRLENYQSSFTVHGLGFIFTGTPLEKVVWITCMFVVIGFAGFMTNRYMNRYFKFEVRTEVRYVENATILLPTITMCLVTALTQRTYCYKNESFHLHHKCSNVIQETRFQVYNNAADKWLDIPSIGDNCYTINQNGTKTLTGTENSMMIMYKAPVSNDRVFIAITSPEEFASRSLKKVLPTFDYGTILSTGVHNVFISKFLKSRLAYPYISNCSNKNDLVPNKFFSLHTKASCHQMCKIKNWLSDCGDVPDIWRNYTNISRPFSNLKYSTRKLCLRAIDDIYFEKIPSDCNCPLPCREISYKLRVETDPTVKFNDTWLLKLYNEDAKVTQIIQVADYPLEDFLGAFGGIVGLAVGASSLSIIEIIMYCILYCMSKLS